MGVIYKAQDTRLDRFVALKFSPDEVAKDPQVLMRFHCEMRAAFASGTARCCSKRRQRYRWTGLSGLRTARSDSGRRLRSVKAGRQYGNHATIASGFSGPA